MAQSDTNPLPLPADPAPRMAPMQPEEFTDETRAFFAQWTGGFFNNADKNPPRLTYAHHPKLADLFSQLNIHLLTTNTLPVKERQIVIMRTVWLCGAKYAWSSHLKTSVVCGLSTDMYAPIQAGPEDPYFSDFERVVMQATDELVRDREVSEVTWKLLAQRWDNKQLLDFLFTVGLYVLTAGVMRSAGVQRDEELRTLAAKFGQP